MAVGRAPLWHSSCAHSCPLPALYCIPHVPIHALYCLLHASLGQRPCQVRPRPCSSSPPPARWGPGHVLSLPPHPPPTLCPCQVLSGLAQASPSVATLRASVPRHTLIGLFRDLRGIAAATNSRRTYCLMFEWLYPQVRYPHTAPTASCLSGCTPRYTTPTQHLAHSSFAWGGGIVRT